ncbi:MAG: hypothetical protein CVU55_11275 [Deltaproteobacteria bacterium HGW-Deltaproteobacteria-13]|nr:MAG: hypothetical protein CVU55_11275 [Deltaproteobacteria bacterium HGW-Deltaproteobacteria-13]
MNKKLLYLFLAFISIFAVAMMHYYHNSFAYDSFGYMKNAHYIMGNEATFDSFRIGLVPFFIAPFVGNFLILYVYYSIVTFLSLLIMVKIVDFFEPKNQEYILFFVIPSYTTYILTSVLQEAFAMFFISLSIYYLLKNKYVLAMCLITLCALSRPAMLAFLPGFVLVLLFYKYIFYEIDSNNFFGSLDHALKKNFLKLLAYGLFCIFIFIAMAALYIVLLSFFFTDPFASYKALSSRWDFDAKFLMGYPLFWFSLFGIFFSPVIAYCYYKIYEFDKRWVLFFLLAFLPYILLIWYQANIRYVIYLVIPIMIGFSQIQISSFKNCTKILIFILFVFSTLYIYGPVVYYYEPSVHHRVINLNYKPFIYFDSENKSNQYQYFCHFKNKREYSQTDKEMIEKHANIIEFLNKYVCK